MTQKRFTLLAALEFTVTRRTSLDKSERLIVTGEKSKLFWIKKADVLPEKIDDVSPKL